MLRSLCGVALKSSQGVCNASNHCSRFPLTCRFRPIAGLGVVKGLGFAAVSYVGVSTAMEFAKDYVFQQFGSLPPSWMQIIGMLQLDVFFNIMFSAYLIRAVLWGMNKSGSKKSINWQGK